MSQINHFADVLRNSVGRSLFSGEYFFHNSTSKNSNYIYPLFALEHHILGNKISTYDNQLLLRAVDILTMFKKDVHRQYLASVFNLKLASVTRPKDLLLEAFVENETFDLLRPDEHLRFAQYGRIPINGKYGVKSKLSPNILVLGCYIPWSQHYFKDLFDNPVVPEERLAAGDSLSEIEKVLLACTHLLSRGCNTITGLDHNRRDIRNVFHRIQYLMAATDKIVLLLSHGSMGAAIEYGVICSNPNLARKTVVLVQKNVWPPFSDLMNKGTFLLQYPITAFYEDELEMLAILDELVLSNQ